MPQLFTNGPDGYAGFNRRDSCLKRVLDGFKFAPLVGVGFADDDRAAHVAVIALDAGATVEQGEFA